MNLTLEYSEADLAQIVTAEVRKLLGTAIADGATIKVESRGYAAGVNVTIVPPPTAEEAKAMERDMGLRNASGY